MLGAIAGDIIGSVYEGKRTWYHIKTPHFEPLFDPQARFTDDTVLTVAVADSILHGGDLVDLLKDYARRYPAAGYGGHFRDWAESDNREPYYSWGNGAAMRVSPVGFAYDLLDEVLLRARWTAEVTHNHPEGIKGAQATAAAIHLARSRATKDAIRRFIEGRFRYDLGMRLEEIRPHYRFDVSSQGSVPQAILAFLESNDYEHAVRLAISLGGDCDTLACIAGGIAQAFYGGVPEWIREQALLRLDDRLREVVEEFEARFPEDID
ncbi:MAG: ADP-ribosylglycohydrolase family protein [Planctomycetes bacterium]|nr:ADP-ribosylglycohydrolase family protein [Planctomycetota bacterium]